ncbi:hypothetical protein ACH42_03650 [Endozoicomonas sp. (ex Bugula neritina AB1)]|nr:hypothetical protein ACH42_03650 [Endozoicomonas sp. (ex Bugula neritina AB1)]
MSNPSRSSMEDYLKQMGIKQIPESYRELKTEYMRQIYRVLPRDKALAMPLKKARQKTAIKR